jgi:hypothetical protein
LDKDQNKTRQNSRHCFTATSLFLPIDTQHPEFELFVSEKSYYDAFSFLGIAKQDKTRPCFETRWQYVGMGRQPTLVLT